MDTSYIVDFKNVSEVGLESSPVAEAPPIDSVKGNIYKSEELVEQPTIQNFRVV